jgi:hypothetical protein
LLIRERESLTLVAEEAVAARRLPPASEHAEAESLP